MEGTSQHTWQEADTEESDRQAGNTQDVRRRKMRKGNVTGRQQEWEGDDVDAQA